MTGYGRFSRSPYYPESVIEAVGRDYCNPAIPMEDLCAKHRVYASTVRSWRDRRGWPKRNGTETRIVTRPHGKTPRPEMRSNLDRVRRWRCECLPGGRLNTEATCGSCGHIPAWAEKGAAA